VIDRAHARVVEEGEIRVPEVEERLEVEKRPVETGEVQVHKTVEEEQQTVPVDLRQEEVHVERRDVAERPIGPGEAAQAFQEGTIRVPVRGEEAVVRKEAVVTGEVAVQKEQTTEREEIADTVRRERVEVDGDQGSDAGATTPAREAAMASTASMAGTPAGRRETTRTTDTTETATRSRGGRLPGNMLAQDMEVVGSDGESVGRVKEVREGDFLVDRPSARDVYVPMDAVTEVANDRVTLNVQGHEVDDMGWPRPSVF
jgi:uncharacterized protein (TIGR02271 family)